MTYHFPITQETLSAFVNRISDLEGMLKRALDRNSFLTEERVTAEMGTMALAVNDRLKLRNLAETIADQMMQMHTQDEEYYAEIFTAMQVDSIGDPIEEINQTFPALTTQTHQDIYTYLKAEGAWC